MTMTSEPSAPLRERIEALEEEQTERVARAHAALAAAQDRAYWLDRWGLDLNALMRRPGARQARAALRITRDVYRVAIRAKRGVAKLPTGLGTLGGNVEDTGAPPPPGSATGDGSFSRAISPDPLRGAPVTDLLYERLSPQDVAEVERRAGDRLPDVDGAERRRLLVHLGVHHGVAGVLERTGLTQEMPPQDVHAMARGPLATGGSTYYADLVVDALESAGSRVTEGMRWLDFGCSSARVVRVLATAYPACEWHGCDPIADAIEWAGEHIEGVSFVRSPEAPPLPYEDERFDCVYAISIWSHFAAPAALAWLREMRRVLRPGGALVMSTHGYQTIAHDHRTDRRDDAQLHEVRGALWEEGFWYRPEFGEAGDHGVANPEWGTAFLTPEWLLAKATPAWRVTAFAPGRVEDNQDLYVLQRR